MRKIIQLNIADEYIEGAGVSIGAAGSHDETEIECHFSELWENTTKTVCWTNSMGEPVTITVTPLMDVDGNGNTYRVPIPAEAKKYSGEAGLTIKGCLIDDETAKEIIAVVTGTAYFLVPEAIWGEGETEDVTPSQAEQLQREIDEIKETICDAQKSAAAAAESHQRASACADIAANCMNNAAASADNALKSEAYVVQQARNSESWAVGGTGTRENEDINNAKYWSEQAQNAAGGGVTSFNGRQGVVMPDKNDYPPAFIGAQTKIKGTAGQVVMINENGEAEPQTKEFGLKPRIIVTTEAGSVVRATTENIIYEAIADGDGIVEFDVQGYSAWYIEASNNGKTDSINLIVDEVRQYRISLTYFYSIIHISTEANAEVIAVGANGAIFTETSDSGGAADILVTVADTYTVSCSVDGVEAVNKVVVDVLETGKTYNAAVGFIYGFTRTQNSAGNVITYTDDCKDFERAYMNYNAGAFIYGSWEAFCTDINRPVMLKYDGTVDYELDRDDQTKKAVSGAASDITSTAYGGNAMAAFKKLYFYRSGNIVKCSRVKINEHYKAYAHMNAAGEERDEFYYSMYKGSNISSVLRSIAGQGVMVSQTAATEVTRAEANNGEGGLNVPSNAKGDGWFTIVKSRWDFINDLLTLISKSDNSQEAFGWGRCASGNTAGVTPGSLKDKGQFFGYTNQTSSVKVFYIEDFYGNYWDRMAGMVIASGRIKTKMTAPYPTPSDSDVYTTAGYVDSNIAAGGTSGNIVTDATMTDQGYIPKTASGGTSVNGYWCDGLWFNNGQVDYAFVGGDWAGGVLVGGRFVHLNHLASDAYGSLGSRLSFIAP